MVNLIYSLFLFTLIVAYCLVFMNLLFGRNDCGMVPWLINIILQDVSSQRRLSVQMKSLGSCWSFSGERRNGNSSIIAIILPVQQLLQVTRWKNIVCGCCNCFNDKLQKLMPSADHFLNYMSRRFTKELDCTQASVHRPLSVVQTSQTFSLVPLRRSWRMALTFNSKSMVFCSIRVTCFVGRTSSENILYLCVTASS